MKEGEGDWVMACHAMRVIDEGMTRYDVIGEGWTTKDAKITKGEMENFF
jgi:hypothetical protein